MEIIEINDKISKQIIDIKDGDCFTHKSNSYMMTDQRKEADRISVNLENGKMKQFNTMDKVIPKLGKVELRDIII